MSPDNPKHTSTGPTSEQIDAMDRIQIGLWKIHEANRRINELITEHNLEHQFGIPRLSSHPQGITMGALAEVIREHQGAFMLERRAA